MDFLGWVKFLVIAWPVMKTKIMFRFLFYVSDHSQVMLGPCKAEQLTGTVFRICH